MMMEDLVKDVNAKLRKELTEAEAGAESPRLVRILKQLVRLTDPEGMDSEEAMADAQAAQNSEAGGPTPSELARATEAAKKMPHKHVPSIYGTCTVCGECTHPRVGTNGLCLNCGANVVTGKAEEKPA